MGKILIERNAGGISGLCVIIPDVHRDTRGYFAETYQQKDMEDAAPGIRFVQDNESGSVKGVLRGLHFQKQYPQTKLVRAVTGCVYDVAVDLREGSGTFGKHFGIMLTGENRKQLLIPRGFAHGFLVLSDEAVFAYKCDEFYHPEDEYGIRWNDPDLAVRWPDVGEGEETLRDGTPLKLSGKDRALPGFREVFRL